MDKFEIQPKYSKIKHLKLFMDRMIVFFLLKYKISSRIWISFVFNLKTTNKYLYISLFLIKIQNNNNNYYYYIFYPETVNWVYETIISNWLFNNM